MRYLKAYAVLWVWTMLTIYISSAFHGDAYHLSAGVISIKIMGAIRFAGRYYGRKFA